MTRPDLAFAYSQLSLSQFVKYPKVVHFQAAERVLQYVCGTYIRDLTYFDQNRCKFLVSAETQNKLIGWVDGYFGSHPDTRKSMTRRLLDASE
jgi:hypothetical protein